MKREYHVIPVNSILDHNFDLDAQGSGISVNVRLGGNYNQL